MHYESSVSTHDNWLGQSLWLFFEPTKIQKFAAINHMSATSTCRWFVIFWSYYFTASVWTAMCMLCLTLTTHNLQLNCEFIEFSFIAKSTDISTSHCSFHSFYLTINCTHTVHPVLRASVQFEKDRTVWTGMDCYIYPLRLVVHCMHIHRHAHLHIWQWLGECFQ